MNLTWQLGVTVQGRCLFEGGGNKLQVPVGHSYFGKESLRYTRLYYNSYCYLIMTILNHCFNLSS